MKEKKFKTKPTRKMPFKRRREGRTDYKKRLALLKSRKPRLVVRKSLNYIRAQIIEFDKRGDRTAASATSSLLREMGWSFSCDNIPAAYLTGLMIGRVAKEAKGKNLDNVVLDIGLSSSTKGSRVYAVAKGAIAAGLKLHVGSEMLPSDERISGKHIAAYNERFKEMPEQFERIKQEILAEKADEKIVVRKVERGGGGEREKGKDKGKESEQIKTKGGKVGKKEGKGKDA